MSKVSDRLRIRDPAGYIAGMFATLYPAVNPGVAVSDAAADELPVNGLFVPPMPNPYVLPVKLPPSMIPSSLAAVVFISMNVTCKTISGILRTLTRLVTLPPSLVTT